jgi:hypothetical protein
MSRVMVLIFDSPTMLSNENGTYGGPRQSRRFTHCRRLCCLGDAPMSDDDEIQSPLTSAYLDMDYAFCARMCNAIAAGLENAPIGIVTTPGTQSPKYFPAEPRLPASPSGNTNF